MYRRRRREAIFVHDPIGSWPMRWFTSVENKSFLQTNDLVTSRSHNPFINTGCFPITRPGCPVRPVSIWVFSFPCAEKVPLLLQIACKNIKRFMSLKGRVFETQYSESKLWERKTNLVNPKDQLCKHRNQGWLKLVKEKKRLFFLGIEQQVLHQWDEIEIQVAILEHHSSRA